MFGKSIFGVATVCFLASLFVGTVAISETRTLTGVETFIYTLRYGTAGLVNASSLADFVIHFVSLVAAAANFVFVFWAMLVFSPTRITSLKWFWWLSLLFLLAAIYTGIQALLDGRVGLEKGYLFWIASLILMLLAPVVSRLERERRVRNSQNTESTIAVRQKSASVAAAISRDKQPEATV